MSIQREIEALCAEISRLLREERERLKLSKYALAGKSGVSQQMIGYVERGTSCPSLDTLLRLTRGMEVDFGKLLAKAEKRAGLSAVGKRARKPAPQSK